MMAMKTMINQRKTRILIYGSLILTSLCLTSCDKGMPSLDAYINTVNVFQGKEEAKILQITDLHWSYGSDVERQQKYLSALVRNTNPDIVVATGDNVCNANKQTWENMLSVFDSFNVPYFIVYGNHDYQGFYRRTFPYEEMRRHARCLNIHPDDNMKGETNFVINLSDGNETKYQLFAIDSLNLNQTWSPMAEYDVISYGQIDWYERQVQYASTQVDEHTVKRVPSLIFTHIPIWQIEYAYRLSKGQTSQGTLVAASGEMRESVYSSAPNELKGTRAWVGYKDTGLFASVEKYQSTKGIFFGHDHKNTFAAKYFEHSSAYDDFEVTLAYGVKTGDGLSFDEEFLGGNLISIKSNGDLQCFRAFQSYQNDYSSGNGYRLENMF